MHYLIVGLLLGFASAVSPGPLQVLVISQAVLRGWRAGALVATAPLVSDIVIVVLTVGVVGILPNKLISAVSLVGSVLVVYIAWHTWTATRGQAQDQALAVGGTGEARPSIADVSYRQAVLLNFLNPHAWLFWVVVGAPLTLRAASKGTVDAIGFVLTFYLALIGVKIILSVLAARGVDWLGSRFQVWMLRGASLGLVVIAVLLAVNGIIGLIQ